MGPPSGTVGRGHVSILLEDGEILLKTRMEESGGGTEKRGELGSEEREGLRTDNRGSRRRYPRMTMFVSVISSSDVYCIFKNVPVTKTVWSSDRTFVPFFFIGRDERAQPPPPQRCLSCSRIRFSRDHRFRVGAYVRGCSPFLTTANRGENYGRFFSSSNVMRILQL